MPFIHVFFSGNHVGIENVRQRLVYMCSGTLTIESRTGVGTKAIIRLPGEENISENSCG